ncbi:hypothetical protein LAZ67_4001660 [Cordylochernes scorpioides]|uniref:Flavoprotein domain-containing protein n=1 Tax=Cordylochernes scorpioides TaxID=51811 RepID=A0ABY6KGW2_9ARAC|nr:hypothetical protein LAZ67_4001660 [Cordylochernes scorpioides]
MSPHILVACTGSVATIKLPALLRELRSKVDNPEIKVVLTQSSKHFLRNCMEEVHQCAVQVLEDKDEWETWNKIGDSVLHIDLWADILVIVPLDANTGVWMIRKSKNGRAL